MILLVSSPGVLVQDGGAVIVTCAPAISASKKWNHDRSLRTVDQFSIARQTVIVVLVIVMLQVLIPELGVVGHAVLAATVSRGRIFSSDGGHVE